MLRERRKLQQWKRLGYVILIIVEIGELLLWFLQELPMVWEAISNIRKGVSSDIQTPWRWLKKTRLRLVFSTISRCLGIGWNTFPRVWYINSHFCKIPRFPWLYRSKLYLSLSSLGFTFTYANLLLTHY